MILKRLIQNGERFQDTKTWWKIIKVYKQRKKLKIKEQEQKGEEKSSVDDNHGAELQSIRLVKTTEEETEIDFVQFLETLGKT